VITPLDTVASLKYPSPKRKNFVLKAQNKGMARKLVMAKSWYFLIFVSRYRIRTKFFHKTLKTDSKNFSRKLLTGGTKKLMVIMIKTHPTHLGKKYRW
jgi:hypothetical protein